MNIQKKFIALMLALCLVFSMAPVIYADDVPQIDLSENTEDTYSDSEETFSTSDYTDLKMQIATANGLDESNYSAESWQALEEAVAEGKRLLEGSHDQDTIDGAAQKIETAIAELSSVDYSQLEALLAYASERAEALRDAWIWLDVEIEEARELLDSGDQEAVDNAVKSLNALLDDIMEKLDAAVKIVVQEVEVEVPPTDDFCNMSGHRAWTVLFFISLVLNIGLVALIVYYLVMKKREADYEVPLVNYDIDDDFDDDFEDDIDETDDIDL